jgi:hypothetical protein
MRRGRLPIAVLMLAITAVVVTIPYQTAQADLGPKPSMHFTFIYEIEPALSIVSGTQYECEDPGCADAAPLVPLSARGFSCSSSDCTSQSLIFSPYHRLSIEFSDGRTRQSNIFEKEYFEAEYHVLVRENDLLVEEQVGKKRPPNILKVMFGVGIVCIVIPAELLVLGFLLLLTWRAPDLRTSPLLYILVWLLSLGLIAILIINPGYLKGILITLVLELSIVLGYALWRKRPVIFLLTVALLMNLFTWIPFRIILGSLSTAQYLAGSIVGEVIIWLAEAGFLAFALRKRAPFWEVLVLSLVLNLASLGIGLLLPF